jgi:hypothetical protein
VYETQASSTLELNSSYLDPNTQEPIYTVIATLSLPAGNFELQTDMVVINRNTVSRQLTCVLNDVGDPNSAEFFQVSIDAGPNAIGIFSWHKASVNSNARMVSVACYVADAEFAPSNVESRYGRLTATSVGTLNIQ